ncbi:diacylglycerol kinase family protein [Limosilactobacillus fastidiosus]|uniref:Diacylglycerol kinase family protein n=1 Tax=Limosilactobacillus fastidiosus TaxID=2759855 RepID=A0A7W3U034_9LACO|nr:diacylglycerol kinase family protein [Limosilactobacillus fastidiosus]MBB1086483.1 diacylglycerol kinase family protein [Limosilactobacillus fastidiosus]MCD7085165.1 diacylglycerol kinase family protein [Limosilactobacillus fastidiosus]MCD7115071.1 diacylglycerol kinase family protein [Limosilactobacillus fastidiosus]MCD7116245.1 diacylglycerol kinase family protein [Limosilactobacillus fastidiosus]
MVSKDSRQTEKNHHLIQAMRHALEGIFDVISQERNMRYHIAVAMIVVILGFILRVDRLEWLWLLLAILVVFSAEFLNTVTEAVTDLLGEHHYDINVKKAKDVAAGGVLITAIFAVLVGLIIFLPRIVKLLGY